MELKGKRALVTGGAVRIGKAIALELAARGCPILLHYGRSKAEARNTAKAIRALGVGCDLVQADLSKAPAVMRLARLAVKADCRILVNNASTFPHLPFQKNRAGDLDLAYAVNLRAPALLTLTLGTALARARKAGRIIQIADVPSNLNRPAVLAYGLSKAGLLQLTRNAAIALAPYVRVNSLSPGPMLMPNKHTAAQKKASVRRSLLKTLGGVDEIARAVAFIAANDFMSGADLKVDGGRELAG